MNKTKTIAGVIALAAIVSVGCAKQEGKADSSAKPVPTEAPETTDAPAATPAPTEAPTTTEAPDDGVQAVGEAFTWEDGVTAIVTGIEVRPLDAGYEQIPNGAIVTLQLQNGTGAVFEPSMGQVDLTFGAAGQQAQFRAVTNEGLGAMYEVAPIPPGGNATVRIGFEGVTDPSKLTVAVEPGFSYTTAFWSQ